MNDTQNIEDAVDGFDGSKYDERAAVPPVRVEAVVGLVHPFPTGIVATNSWAGRTEWPCYVLRETPKRFEVMFWRSAHRQLVPKYAVRFDDPKKAAEYGFTVKREEANHKADREETH